MATETSTPGFVCSLSPGRVLTPELLLPVVSLPLLKGRTPARARSFRRDPRRRWGGAGLTQGGAQGSRHHDIPVSDHEHVLRRYISSTSWLRLPVTLESPSDAGAAPFGSVTPAANGSLSSAGSGSSGVTSAAVGEGGGSFLASNTFWDLRVHAAVGKGGSPSLSSSTFRTPRIHLVSRFLHVESRPAKNS